MFSASAPKFADVSGVAPLSAPNGFSVSNLLADQPTLFILVDRPWGASRSSYAVTDGCCLQATSKENGRRDTGGDFWPLGSSLPHQDLLDVQQVSFCVQIRLSLPPAARASSSSYPVAVLAV